MRSHEQHRHSPRVVQQVSHAILRQRRVHEQEGASCALRNQLAEDELGTLLGHDRDDGALLQLLCGHCSCRCLQLWNVIICSVQERLQRDGFRRAVGPRQIEHPRASASATARSGGHIDRHTVSVIRVIQNMEGAGVYL